LREQTTRTNHQRPPVQEEEWEYVVSRYLPTLYDLILNISNGTLSTKDYPFYIKEEESEARSTSTGTSQSKRKAPVATWGGSTENQSLKKVGPRIIVFIAGGLSYSEMRAAAKLTQIPFNLDIILGSTHLIDPPQFLKQVASLHKNTLDEETYKSASGFEKQNT